MKIIIGHTNTDLDCLGSMVLARRLYPDHLLLRSRLIHPVARRMYNLFRKQAALHPKKEIKGQKIDHIIVVDTRSYQRTREFFDYIGDYKGELTVYDHHPADSSDLPYTQIIEASHGANTTLLGLEVMEKGIQLSPEEATIALTGIFADTGNFTHANCSKEDFLVAAFLREQGASISMTADFLRSLNEKYQITLFHDLLNNLVYRDIKGHFIILSYLELEEEVGGMAAISEKIMDVESPDALFCAFYFKDKDRTLIVGRSKSYSIVIPSALKEYSAKGHSAAASAQLSGRPGLALIDEISSVLEEQLPGAVRARDIMSSPVHCMRPQWTIMESSIFLEERGHTGAPVLDEQGAICGFMTLRNIMKARKADNIKAPVSAYMTHKLFTGNPDMTVRDIQQFFYQHNIGHLPVVEEEKLIGIVTRSDLLRIMGNKQENKNEKK